MKKAKHTTKARKASTRRKPPRKNEGRDVNEIAASIVSSATKR